MSRLGELIRQFCPEGIKYDKIKNVFSRLKGTAITASKMTEIACPDGEIRIFAGGKTIIDTHEKDIPKANITRVPAVLVQSRGIIDVIYYDKPFTFKNEMWAYSSSNPVTTKFLYYVLKNNIEKFREAASGMGSLPQISLSVTDNFLVPIPPLEIQQEIVRILDQFTQLTAELTAEFTARKKQFSFYQTVLFQQAQNATVKYLDEISENCDNLRKPVTSGNRTKGNYPYYGASGIVDYVDSYIFDGDYLLVSEDGANLLARSTPIAFSITGKNWVNNHAHVLHFEEYATRRYVEFYLNAMDLSPYVTGGAQPKLNQKNLNRIPISLPSLPEQRRIVAILDRFDTLCNDLTSGLPAEIAARQKQYEYYRDKLLTFKKLEE